MKLATLDLGSNTFLLLVIEILESESEPRVLVDECRFVRLGQGLATNDSLAPEAIERGHSALREYRALLDPLKVTRLAAVGTQALRQAANREEFLRPAAAILGTEIDVIDGAREAELVATAVLADFPALGDDGAVIADVGGNSTEFVVVTRDFQGATAQSRASVPIGAVRLSEDHLRSDPASRSEIASLVTAIDAELATLNLPAHCATVMGTAGTATSLGSIELKLLHHDSARVHGYTMTPARVDRLLAQLLQLSVAEKRDLRGLEPKRADVIAAGVAIYSRLLHRVNANKFVISDRGVRWGLARELANPSIRVPVPQPEKR